MLQDEYREHKKISKEYQKLLILWNKELINNPATNIKRSKISSSEHAQFTLIHLFNDFLNQIWSDSQSMIQSIETQENKNTGSLPTDSIFTMNIHGLHLMKSSLISRQQLFKIIDELNNINLIENEKSDDSLCCLSDSTISQEYITYQNDQQNIKCDTTIDIKKDFNGYFDLEPNKQLFIDSTISRPVRLMSSPSTPTIGNLWEELPDCSQNFTPGCNFSTYFPRDEDTHKLSCHFCQKTIPLKKSFSVENLHSFQQGISSITDDESGSGNDEDSSFDVTSLYRYNKEDYQNDKVKRESLENKDQIFMDEQCQQLNDTEGSQKIEIENDKLDSSSNIQYSTTSIQAQIKTNKISQRSTDIPSTYLRSNSSSRRMDTKKTSSSSTKYSLEGINGNLDNKNLYLVNKSHNKIDTSIPKASDKRKPSIKSPLKISRSSVSIVRSFSSKNICNMFSTRKLNGTTSINK